MDQHIDPSRLANWRYRPVFILFLICGPTVLIPFVLLLPTMMCLRSIWQKQIWPLRIAVVAFVTTAFCVTGPFSEMFFDPRSFPIHASAEATGGWGQIQTWLLPAINRALVANCVLLPLTTFSASNTLLMRRRRVAATETATE